MPPPTMTQLQGSALSSGSHGSMKKRKFELKQENFMSRGSPAESEAVWSCDFLDPVLLQRAI